MAIGLHPEHLDLAESVTKTAGRHAAMTDTRAGFEDSAAGIWPPSWDRFREQGLLALHLPEEHGGDGAGLLEASIVAEECARALVPGPLVSTLIAGMAIGAMGTAAAHGELLPKLVAGAVACCATGTTGLVATPQDGGWSVSGVSAPILAGLAAQILVLGAQGPDGEVWFVLEGPAAEQVIRKQSAHVDLTRDLGVLQLDDVHVEMDSVLAGSSQDVRRLAGVLFAAEAVGLSRWCLDTGLAYVKVREQFGRPVGSFQAIKHKCARMAIDVELMTAVTWDAVRAWSEGPDQFALAGDAAIQLCLQKAVDLGLDTVTLLGGIGYTWEHDVHLYWRRAMSNAALLGPRASWERSVGRTAQTVGRAAAVELGDEPDGLRDEVRAILEEAAALPEPERRTLLADKGLVAPQYPVPYGLGVGPVGQVVIMEEFARAGLAQPSTVIGEWALPTVLAHGTDEQREALVRRTLRGQVSWCQLFSEPGAGSDLASLRTRATKVEEGWRLDGQKVWTSSAQDADWGICLARTDPDAPKHKGLSYFLVDMRTPGIDIRPLREANGGYLFNEVFLDGVIVPDDRLVGVPGEGWRMARTTLGNERVSMGSGMGGRLAPATLAKGADLDDDAVVRDVGRLTSQALALEAMGRRALLRQLSGLTPGAESSMLKLAASQFSAEQARTVFAWQGAAGAATDTDSGATGQALLSVPPVLIGGGTAEIQLNVISELVLGLPRG